MEPLGTLRLPTINSLDFRVEKAFQIVRNQRLQRRANLYNVTNANTVTARTVQSGPNYLRPTAIRSPRIAEFSVSYTY